MAVAFSQELAAAKSRVVPVYLRKASERAFFRRWAQMLAVAAASAWAASVLEDEARAEDASDGREPWLQALLSEDRLP